MRKVYIVIRGEDYEGSNPEEVFTSRKKAVSYIEKEHPDFQHWIDRYGWEEWRRSCAYFVIIDMELM